MGLVARIVEEHGVPTLTYCLARDIMVKVKPPRAVFIDYPLGYTTGRPNDVANQRDIIKSGLDALIRFTAPGSIIDLPFTWSGDDRSWEEDMRVLYLEKRESSIMKRQRILGEGLSEYQDVLKEAEKTISATSE